MTRGERNGNGSGRAGRRGGGVVLGLCVLAAGLAVSIGVLMRDGEGRGASRQVVEPPVATTPPVTVAAVAPVRQPVAAVASSPTVEEVAVPQAAERSEGG